MDLRLYNKNRYLSIYVLFCCSYCSFAHQLNDYKSFSSDSLNRHQTPVQFISAYKVWNKQFKIQFNNVGNYSCNSDNTSTNFPCIRSVVENPASLAKPGQARLSGFLAKLTGKMWPGKAWQAWPRPRFLGNLGHKSPAFSAMLVPRPDFPGNLGQKKKKTRLSWPLRC